MNPVPTQDIIGTSVAQVTYADVLDRMAFWIAKEGAQPHTIVAANVHVLTEATLDPDFRAAIRDADMVLPDGMPLVWASRLLGSPLRDRCYGPALMRMALEQSGQRPFVHFLYGSSEATLAALEKVIRATWPNARIAGAIAPAFGELRDEDEASHIDAINQSGANVLWVGLGCPKQELWMARNRSRLHVPVVLAVGAAFDFIASVKPQAPAWMQARGLEWLFRLWSEPRRLWRRYLLRNPLFILRVLRQAFGQRRQQALFATALGLMLFVMYGLYGNGEEVDRLGRSAIRWMVVRWSGVGGDLSHGWLIPLVSGYLIYQKRAALAAAPRRASWIGLLVIVLSLVLHWIGLQVQQTRLSLLSLIGLLWGIPFYFYGGAVARLLLFPCAYLVFCIPFSFLNGITVPLRIFASAAAAFLLNGLGIATLRVGTAIHSSAGMGFSMDVADPCSGLRSLLSLTALAAVYAYLTQRTLIRRWILFLSAVPVAIAGNTARIVSIAVVAQLFGQERAMSLYHEGSGFLVFAVSVLLMVALGELLRKVRVRKEVATP